MKIKNSTKILIIIFLLTVAIIITSSFLVKKELKRIEYLMEQPR